jgi:hypothetical protein
VFQSKHSSNLGWRESVDDGDDRDAFECDLGKP